MKTYFHISTSAKPLEGDHVSHTIILQIKYTTSDINTHLKIIMGLTLDPQFTYNKNIDNTTAKASKNIPIIKLFYSTK